MKRIVITIAFYLAEVVHVLLMSVATSRAETVDFGMRPITSTARAGIPVVIELDQINRTNDEQEVFDLTDPYLILIEWEWLGPTSRYKIHVRDFHCPLPDLLPPVKVVIPAQEHRKWHCTIPTPASFGNGVIWKLRATLKALFSPTSRDVIQEASLLGRDLNVMRASTALGPSWAQATLLEWHSASVFRQLDHKGMLGGLEGFYQQGDRQAEMLLFSQSLLTGKARAIAS